MAALPYMQFYIADYLADTMHLSTEEHGAYLLLMFNYWQTGKPIPKTRLSKIARISDARWPEIEKVLEEFFESDGESWIHLRMERDIENIMSSPRGKKLPNGDDLSGHRGYVYFITSPDSTVVKIGYSKNPWARIGELRRSHGANLSVVATVKTKQKSEVSIHAILSDFRSDGGWFHKNDCINSLVSAISEASVTTVEAIRDYVVDYAVATTTTTNTDPDPDKELKDKTLLSHGTEIAMGPDEDGSPHDVQPETSKSEKATRHKYPPEFETTWQAYPRRPGSQDKHGAYKAWTARRREGISTEIMLKGVLRYAAFVVATGKSGTEFIKQAKTFFGPSLHFEDDWQINIGGSNAAKNSSSTGSTAWQQVRDARNAERAKQGLAPLGDDGSNILGPVGEEEWRDTIDGLDGSDFEILG